MAGRDSRSLAALGFLTVVPQEQQGLFGGYLVLDANGRPLEFHCTAPVKTNRAQQILFGPTLEPYLYGEQIGQTLVNSARAKPPVICTDQEAMLAVRDHITTPVVLLAPVAPPTESTAAPSSYRLDPAHVRLAAASGFTLGGHHWSVSAGHADDQPTVCQRLEPLAQRFDLAEPFARIREAIEEAQRSGR
jgi:hypothetical protein